MTHEIPEEAPAAAGEAPPGDAGAADPLEALRSERDALHDRLLRTAAEFDNYRKRVDRERREQADLAASTVLSELLPIIDDLERALQAPRTAESDAYRAGVELIHRQMLELLRRRGVTPMDVVGVPFDPHVHQAVAQEPSTDVAEGHVIAEMRRGYLLGDRLLRPAMVKVATA